MSIYHTQSRKLESEHAYKKLDSKWSEFYIFIPCWLALVHGIALDMIDLGKGDHSIVMASLLALVAGSISSNRKKILQQHKVIQQLQEQLQEACSHSQQSPAGDDQKATPEK